MTYCVGMLLDQGLVFLSDSRTNAGVDHINTFRKMAVWERPGLTYAKASDEHGFIEIAAGAAAPALGEKLLLVPGHCDPTVNLYDWYVGIRQQRVECLWPVAARGALT